MEVMPYIKSNHSKNLLLVHIIFSCKYRRKLLVKYGDEIKQIVRDVCTDRGWGIKEMEVDIDHLHILLRYKPTDALVDIISLLKQVTTYRIWRQNNNEHHLRRCFWNEKTFWADGYFVCSVGQVSHETIAKYIKNQG
jgi:putative transposase